MLLKKIMNFYMGIGDWAQSPIPIFSKISLYIPNKIHNLFKLNNFIHYLLYLWKQLIPDIFEIGVLNLKNSFGTYKFTNNQIKEMLLDLRNYKPEINEEEINTNINNNNNNY